MPGWNYLRDKQQGECQSRGSDKATEKGSLWHDVSPYVVETLSYYIRTR